MELIVRGVNFLRIEKSVIKRDSLSGRLLTKGLWNVT